MILSHSQLATIIGERTFRINDTKSLAKEVASYLISENIVGDLESLMREVLVYRQSKGIIEANVTSAHDLSKETLTSIEQLIKSQHTQAHSVTLSTSHDDSVIGGLKITLANEQLDLTIKNKLDIFKRLTGQGSN